MTVKRKTIVIQTLLIIVFLLCGAYVGKYFYDIKRSEQNYDDLQQLVKSYDAEDVTDNYIPERAENGMLEAYYGLYERNNDLVGWIKILDTPIDYPVVQYKDNEFYLRRDFDKKYQIGGIPFLDCQCGENSINDIIYAHNMRNGSMFAALLGYANEDFYKSHKQIFYDTLYDKGKYDIIAVFSTVVGSKNEFKYYQYTDMNEEQFNEYVKKAKELSLYETGVTAEYGDRLLTLSTCAYRISDERFVVVAKRKTY